MSKITTLIGRQAYELIRNRIGEILIDELAAQTTLGNQYTSVDVTVEGLNVVNTTETSVVKISLADGEFSNEHAGASDGVYLFNIDCFCKAKSSAGVEGNYKAAEKTQALMGIIRYILKDPQYRTLGFTAGFIGGCTVQSIKIGEAEQKDLFNVVGGRLVFKVKALETNGLLNATLMNNYHTSVILGTSAQGYTYNTNP